MHSDKIDDILELAVEQQTPQILRRPASRVLVKVDVLLLNVVVHELHGIRQSVLEYAVVRLQAPVDRLLVVAAVAQVAELVAV